MTSKLFTVPGEFLHSLHMTLSFNSCQFAGVGGLQTPALQKALMTQELNTKFTHLGRCINGSV